MEHSTLWVKVNLVFFEFCPKWIVVNYEVRESRFSHNEVAHKHWDSRSLLNHRKSIPYGERMACQMPSWKDLVVEERCQCQQKIPHEWMSSNHLLGVSSRLLFSMSVRPAENLIQRR